MKEKTWEIDIKLGESGYEVSVVKASNELGMKSWGWFGKEKVYIAGCPHNKPNVAVIMAMLEVAEDLCGYLNASATMGEFDAGELVEEWANHRSAELSAETIRKFKRA